jgi:hypothetical protein
MKEFITFDSKKPLARNVLHHLRAFLYLLSGHSRRHHPADALPRCSEEAKIPPSVRTLLPARPRGQKIGEHALAMLKVVYFREGPDAAVRSAKDMVEAAVAVISHELGPAETQRFLHVVAELRDRRGSAARRAQRLSTARKRCWPQHVVGENGSARRPSAQCGDCAVVRDLPNRRVKFAMSE